MIPVAVVGTDVVAPPGKTFGSFTRPIVRFGEPLDFSRYEGMENDRYILRSITDEIMYEIMQLSGQEYVDMYAARAKEETKASAEPAAERRRPGDLGEEEGVLTGLTGHPSHRHPRAPATGGRRGPRHRRGPDVPLAGGAAAAGGQHAVGLNVYRRGGFAHPVARGVILAGLVVWTGFAIWAYDDRRRRGPLLGGRRPGSAAGAIALTRCSRATDCRPRFRGSG